MSWNYYCPFCKTHLNPVEKYVVLLADSQHGNGLFLFNSEPGNYELILPEGMEIKKGQLWDFYCPVCRENLKSEANENIATLRMTDPSGSYHAVMFSRIAGEHCTFLVTADGVKEYGPDSLNYASVLWNKYF